MVLTDSTKENRIVGDPHKLRGDVTEKRLLSSNSTDDFKHRHIGPSAEETRAMLQFVGYDTLDKLVDEAIPAQIRLKGPLRLPEGRSEHEVLDSLRQIASQNHVFRS